MNTLKDTKAAQEVRALKDFFDMLSNDLARACYGPKHVEVAHDRMVVQSLLITDDLFRNADVATRQKYVNLVNSVKGSGGTAHIFSSMHVSGEHKLHWFPLFCVNNRAHSVTPSALLSKAGRCCAAQDSYGKDSVTYGNTGYAVPLRNRYSTIQDLSEELVS